MTFTLDEPVRVTRRLQVLGFAALAVVVALGVLTWRLTRPNLDPDIGARTAAGVTAMVYTEEWGGDYSSVGGRARLEVLEGGCLGLAGGHLLVLPYGARVVARDGEITVDVPGSDGRRTFRPGDVVPIGGATPQAIAGFGGNLADHVPSACRRYDVVSGIEMLV